jgi:hypothetical protein
MRGTIHLSSRRTAGTHNHRCCDKRVCGPSVAQHRHSWLWVPGRASLARDDGDTFSDSLFKESLHSSSRACPGPNHRFKLSRQGRRPSRHCERSEAIHRAAQKEKWIAPRNDVVGVGFEFQRADTDPHSRGTICPKFCIGLSLEIEEGAGKAGCPEHPQPVCEKNAHGSHHGCAGNHPAFPAQWFYGLLRALPGDEFILSPSLAN